MLVRRHFSGERRALFCYKVPRLCPLVLTDNIRMRVKMLGWERYWISGWVTEISV